LSGGGARYTMTGPPVLATRDSRKKIRSAIKGHQPANIKNLAIKTSKSGTSIKIICRTTQPLHRDTIFWTKEGKRLTTSDSDVSIKIKKYRSVLKIDASEDGVYACTTTHKNGRIVDTKTYKVTADQPSIKNEVSTSGKSTTQSPASSTYSSSTSTTTTTLPANPSVDMACPIAGYCLNGGQCSFIPWLGELSCACAPGYHGARCDRKTTSALYSSLSSMSHTLCMFGISNPYHAC